MSVWNPEETVDHEFGGVTLKIASSYNDAFMEKMRRIEAPYKRQKDKGTLTVRKQRELAAQAMAGEVLRGWDADQLGQALNAGGPVPYSDAKAVELLTDKIDLFLEVQRVAGNRELFCEDQVEALEGNS